MNCADFFAKEAESTAETAEVVSQGRDMNLLLLDSRAEVFEFLGHGCRRGRRPCGILTREQPWRRTERPCGDGRALLPTETDKIPVTAASNNLG